MEKDNVPDQIPDQPRNGTKLFENQLLTYSETAIYLSISESYLRRLKAQKQIAYVPMGGRGVRFRVGSLNRWIEKREMT